jgi:hypothetical protein
MFSLLGEFENKALPSYKIMDLFEQAKAMHKEEIINAHTIGYVIGGGNGYIHEPEQYYNETFGGNNEQL